MYVYTLNCPINKFDNDGRETKAEYRECIKNPFDCKKAMGCRDKALELTRSKFRVSQGNNDAADAFRHCYWSCCMAQKIGISEAKKFGDAHEDEDPPLQKPCEKDMDLFNNDIGRNLGASNPKGDCDVLCDGAPLQKSCCN